MKDRIRSGLVLLLTAMLTGCVVSQSTHELTLQDLQATKSDLDQKRVQNEALNKQLKALREANAKLKEDLEKSANEITSLNTAVGKERQAGENKLKDLERQVKELATAKKTVMQDLEVQKQRNEDHLKTIRRQQKELKEREQAALLTPPAPTKPAPPSAPEPPKPPVAPEGSLPNAVESKPVQPPPAATSPAPNKPIAVPEAPKPPVTGVPTPAGLVDVNRASPIDLTLNLGLGKEDSDKLIKNRPYKTKEELVSKAGIAKATVDKMRDKITVGP
jgi:DNA uptake protein ComE-like DNA-binding protein